MRAKLSSYVLVGIDAVPVDVIVKGNQVKGRGDGDPTCTSLGQAAGYDLTRRFSTRACSERPHPFAEKIRSG